MRRDAAHIPFVSSGSYPLRTGCAVRPLVDGEPAFQRICAAVESARRSVWVTVAFIERDVRIGSTNIANRSFFGDTELNVSFWDTPTVRALRCELLREHLDVDTADLDDRAALRLYAEHARKNTARRERGEPLAGLAFALDPARYGRSS